MAILRAIIDRAYRFEIGLRLCISLPKVQRIHSLVGRLARPVSEIHRC